MLDFRQLCQQSLAVCVLGLCGAPFMAGQGSGQLPPFVERFPKGSSLRAAIDAEPSSAKAAELLLTAVFTKCGDSRFLFAKDGASGARLFEFKPPFRARKETETAEYPRSVSRLEELNGVQEPEHEYKFIPSFVREVASFNDATTRAMRWTEWRTGDDVFSPDYVRLTLVRRSGHWTITGSIKGVIGGVDNFFDEIRFDQSLPRCRDSALAGRCNLVHCVGRVWSSERLSNFALCGLFVSRLEGKSQYEHLLNRCRICSNGKPR